MNCELKSAGPSAFGEFSFDHFELIGNQVFFRTQSCVYKFTQVFDGGNIGRCNSGGSIAHGQPRCSGKRPHRPLSQQSGSFRQSRSESEIQPVGCELCRQSSVGILSSPDRCRPCQRLLFLTGLNQAAVAVGSEGIGGVNPKVFCDRRPLCDLQDWSICASLTIFHSRNWHYDLHGALSEFLACEWKLFRS